MKQHGKRRMATKAAIMAWILACGACLAAPVLAAPLSSGGDAGKPIEINADNLEVFRPEKKAIFSGHVVAIQGNTRLTAKKMIVHYREMEERGEAEKKSAVSRIEVEGDVLLTTPEETASGARGNYDVDKKVIYLKDNVTLTRGKNVLKGDSLTYDINKGHSVVNSSKGGANAQSGKRVRALFVPDKKQ